MSVVEMSTTASGVPTELQVYEDELYALAGSYTNLFKYSNEAWVLVCNGNDTWGVANAPCAPHSLRGTTLLSFNSKLYALTTSGYLLEYDGGSSWTAKASPVAGRVFSIITEYDSTLWAGFKDGDYDYGVCSWNGSDAWVLEATGHAPPWVDAPTAIEEHSGELYVYIFNTLATTLTKKVGDALEDLSVGGDIYTGGDLLDYNDTMYFLATEPTACLQKWDGSQFVAHTPSDCSSSGLYTQGGLSLVSGRLYYCVQVWAEGFDNFHWVYNTTSNGWWTDEFSTDGIGALADSWYLSGGLYVTDSNGDLWRYGPLPAPSNPSQSNPPSGVAVGKYKVVLSNKNRYTYKSGDDTILSKIDILRAGKASYLQNVTVYLWMNYDGTWTRYEEGTTNRYGSVSISHSAAAVAGVNQCLGIAQATIDGTLYISNPIRYNFE